MDDHVACAACGVVFCMPAELLAQRRRNHNSFYCPNGHSNYFAGKTSEQKTIERLEREVGEWQRWHQEVWRSREDLIAVLRECPIPGCPYRSPRRIARDPMAMGRGVERVRADLLEHLVRDHAGHIPPARQLAAAVS